jgi:hypothetical protein
LRASGFRKLKSNMGPRMQPATGLDDHDMSVPDWNLTTHCLSAAREGVLPDTVHNYAQTQADVNRMEEHSTELSCCRNDATAVLGC